LLFDAIEEAGRRTLRVIDEVSTPQELRSELRANIADMMEDTNERRGGLASLEAAVDHVYWVVRFLFLIVDKLDNISTTEDSVGRIASRIRGIAQGLEEEAEGYPRYPKPSEISG
jgi:hypothetical protein